MILRGKAASRDREIEEARQLNHEMAGLMALAFHQPKKLPKYKPIKSKSEPKDDAVQAEMVRGYFIGLALRSERSGDGG